MISKEVVERGQLSIKRGVDFFKQLETIMTDYLMDFNAKVMPQLTKKRVTLTAGLVVTKTGVSIELSLLRVERMPGELGMPQQSKIAFAVLPRLDATVNAERLVRELDGVLEQNMSTAMSAFSMSLAEMENQALIESPHSGIQL